MASPRSISLGSPIRNVFLAGTPSAAACHDRAAQAMREKEAFERGMAEGERRATEAREAGEKRLREAHAQVIERVAQAVPGIIRQSETALIQLAIEVARKLVADLPITPEMVGASVRAALGEVAEEADCVVHLNPADLELFQHASLELVHSSSSGRKVRFQASPDVTPGGCMVETRFGIVDARRETKLRLIERSVSS